MFCVICCAIFQHFQCHFVNIKLVPYVDNFYVDCGLAYQMLLLQVWWF